MASAATIVDADKQCCPGCHAVALYRLPRHGFSDAVLSACGWFPWRCGACYGTRHLRVRGRRGPKHSA